jgi:RNA polymerase sigma-70 factor (ECF subfamily)
MDETAGTMTAAAALMDEPEAPSILLANIRAAKAGDSRAFDNVMIATERRVATLAWRILGDAEEVKEALQETFLRVFRHLGRYDERYDFFGWLYRIAVNVCRDLEKRRRRRTFFGRLEESAPPPPTGLRIDLARAIDSLPPKERLAVILRDVEELSTEEVAAILGSAPSTVRVQISKGRAKLRKWLS